MAKVERLGVEVGPVRRHPDGWLDQAVTVQGAGIALRVDRNRNPAKPNAGWFYHPLHEDESLSIEQLRQLPGLFAAAVRAFEEVDHG